MERNALMRFAALPLGRHQQQQTPHTSRRRKRLRTAVLAFLFGVCILIFYAFQSGVVLLSARDNSSQDDYYYYTDNGEDNRYNNSSFGGGKRGVRERNGGEQRRGDAVGVLDDLTSVESDNSETKPVRALSSRSRPAKIRHITVQTGETPPWCRMLLSFFLSNSDQLTQTAIYDAGAAIKGNDNGYREEEEKGNTPPQSLRSLREDENNSLSDNRDGSNREESPLSALRGEEGKASERVRQITVHNIGWGKKYAHSARPAWILEWLEAHPQMNELAEDDIVMFADGGDTLYTGVSSDIIRAEYDEAAPLKSEVDENGVLVWDREVSQKGGRNRPPSLPALLFNAEANCYHQQTFGGSWGPKKGRCLSAYRRYHNKLRRKHQNIGQELVGKANKELLSDPLVPENVRHLSHCGDIGDPSSALGTKFKYLNAGAWIGRVWAVKKVFTAIKAIVDGNKHLWCDQSVIGGVLLKGTFSEWEMGIDTQNRFFLPIYHLDERSDFCPSHYNDRSYSDQNDESLDSRLPIADDHRKRGGIREGSGIRRIGRARLGEGNEDNPRLGASFGLMKYDNTANNLLEGEAHNHSALAIDRTAFDLPRIKAGRASAKKAKPRLLTMCHSNHTPALLHFNGKSEKMARFLTRRTSWWQENNLRDLRNRGARDAQRYVEDLDLQARGHHDQILISPSDETKYSGRSEEKETSVVEGVWESWISLAGARGEGTLTKVKDKCPNLVLPP